MKQNRSISAGPMSTYFPQDPKDGQQHAEHGRVWQWVESGGMWRSVYGGVASGEGVEWEDILNAPDFSLEGHTHVEFDELGDRIDAIEDAIVEDGGFGRQSEDWVEVEAGSDYDDSQINADLAAETQARIDADAAEVQARSDGDSAEAQARILADNALQTAVDGKADAFTEIDGGNY